MGTLITEAEARKLKKEALSFTCRGCVEQVAFTDCTEDCPVCGKKAEELARIDLAVATEPDRIKFYMRMMYKQTAART